MEDIWRKYTIQIIAGFLGLIFMGVGVFQLLSESAAVNVEVIEPGEVEAAATTIVLVDVSGAVVKPGVYELKERARIADALTVAGGLSAEADRNFVARFINQAQQVEDGMKIYIPLQGESLDKGFDTPEGASYSSEGRVNINTASLSQLDTLWGVGEARAQQIVDNRPYASIEELVSKGGLPQNVLDTNKNKLSVH